MTQLQSFFLISAYFYILFFCLSFHLYSFKLFKNTDWIFFGCWKSVLNKNLSNYHQLNRMKCVRGFPCYLFVSPTLSFSLFLSLFIFVCGLRRMKVSLRVVTRFNQIHQFKYYRTVHEHGSKQTECFARIVETVKYYAFHSLRFVFCLLTNTCGHYVLFRFNWIEDCTICAQHTHYSTVGVCVAHLEGLIRFVSFVMMKLKNK